MDLNLNHYTNGISIRLRVWSMLAYLSLPKPIKPIKPKRRAETVFSLGPCKVKLSNTNKLFYLHKFILGHGSNTLWYYLF